MIIYTCLFLGEVKVLAEIDLENANKLKNYSILLSNSADGIKNANYNLNSQISNLNLDTKDIVNEILCRKVEEIKSSSDELMNLLKSMSNEAQQISTKLSIMK